MLNTLYFERCGKWSDKGRGFYLPCRYVEKLPYALLRQYTECRVSCCLYDELQKDTYGENSSCFLDAFVKLQKAAVSFFISVRPSVRVELGSHWTDLGDT
jgi:hypothetical protein